MYVLGESQKLTLLVTFQGDDGGALVFVTAFGGWLQIGVFSFVSNAGCTSGNPAVYVRVTSILPWIRDQTGIS
jgi:secreted trypsin-like serine protease